MRLLVLPVLMLLVAPTATVGQVFWSDDFDSTAPSAGTRTVLGFANTDGGFCNNDYFVRTNDNDGIDPPADFSAIWAGIHGAFYWGGFCMARRKVSWTRSSATAIDPVSR